MGRIASTVTALGNGTYDGDIGFIRVAQGGETGIVKLHWDLANAKWISPALPVLLMGNDGGSFGAARASWGYLAGSTGFTSFGWTLRAGCIQWAGALYTAGLHLQDRIQGRFANTAGALMSVSPWFYEFNGADAVVFDNDTGAQGGKTWNGAADLGFQPSTLNLGHGAVLESGSTIGGANSVWDTSATYGDALGGYAGLTRGTGWDDIKFFLASTPSGAALGGVPTTSATVPTKTFLYPTFYYFSGAVTTKVETFSYEVRWTS